ncbi:hypothetical protein [Sphingomonas sp. XXL09]
MIDEMRKVPDPDRAPLLGCVGDRPDAFDGSGSGFCQLTQSS